MKLKNIYTVALASLTLAACGDMDYKEYVVNDKEFIEGNFSYVGGFMSKIYNDLDADFGNFGGAMHSSATDESVFSTSGNAVEDFLNGAWSPANPRADIWTSAWEGITYCNEFLDNWTGLTFDELKLNDGYVKRMFQYNNYQYECRALRAYYYFTLVRQYGDIPFKEHNATGAEETALPRTSANEIFNFIESECDDIKDKIIVDYTDIGDMSINSPETGRINKIAVLAIKAQAAMYHASPLFNPNNDVNLWHKACLAYKELMEECKAEGKTLCPKYSTLWSDTYYSDADFYKENLFTRRVAASTSFETYNLPVGYSSGKGGNCPTQDLVDAYDCTDGLPIDESPLYDPQNPYANRDSRLSMTVACNGDVWPNDIVNTSYSALQTYIGGAHGSGSGTSYYTPTSYYLKKFVYASCILRSGYTTAATYHPWIVYRLGGAYLNYAECLFQYFKAQGKENAADAVTDEFDVAARTYASKTRVRAGLPEFPRNMTNDEFWARYKKERQVELAFEGHRFYDVRRWKDTEEATKFLNIHAMDITLNEDGSYSYAKRAITRGDGKWQEKWNLFPISQTEISKSGGALTQNPGW